MRWLYQTLAAAVLLLPLGCGFSHVAGICDCDRLNDPCEYCPKYPLGNGCSSCQAGSVEHLTPALPAQAK